MLRSTLAAISPIFVVFLIRAVATLVMIIYDSIMDRVVKSNNNEIDRYGPRDVWAKY